MGRTSLHLHSWVLRAVTSCRVTQSPDSAPVSNISPKGRGSRPRAVNEIMQCSYKNSSVAFKFFTFFSPIIISSRIFQILCPVIFCQGCCHTFNAELHLESSQTNEFSTSTPPHLFSVHLSGISCFSKTSLNTSIMKSTGVIYHSPHLWKQLKKN